VAGGVGLLAAIGYTVLRHQPSRPVAGSGPAPAMIFEPLDDGEIERVQASELRPAATT
jgi:hypothetical protein